MNFRQVKYFVATAELGQVSRAARELSISQSAVTTAVRDLEAEIGARLFERTARGMALTEPGRRFLETAYRLLATVEEARQTAVADAGVSGTLSVAATYTVLGYFLPQHLERLARRFPALRLHLFEHSREMIEDGLLANRFDMAMVLTSNVNNPELVTETLQSSRRRLWVPANHPLLGVGRVGFAEIAREPYIMLTVDEAAHTALRYWSSSAHRPDIRLRTSSVEAVRSMVANGLGVAILSDMVYRPWSLEGKRLETIVPAEPVPAMDVGLAWRRGVEMSPAMRVFRDYFVTHYLAPEAHHQS